LAPVFSAILGDPQLTRLFRISTLIIPAFAAASFYFSYFTGLHRFNIQAFLKIMRSVMRVGFIISLAYIFKLPGSIIGYIIAPAAVFLIAYGIDKLKVDKEIAASSSTPRNDKPYFDWHKLTSYAWQIVIFFLAYELLISIDLYLVQGILKNDYLTGIYNASLTLGRIPYYLFYALTVILLPVISKSTFEKNFEKTARIISQSLRMMLILLIPGIILMSLYANQIIRIFYSNRYQEAGYPMSILVWGVGFLTIYYVLCFVMSGAGIVKKPMYISIIGLALNSVLNYFLIKKYGLTGSAIATTITSAIITFIMLYYIWIDFKVVIKLKSFLKMVLAGFIIYLAALYLPRGQWTFILSSLILFALYIGILMFLGEIKKEDILSFKNSLMPKKK
jgi:O-antigen/teichoic acid export membrane protein